MPICFKLERQAARWARRFARLRAGSSMAARMAIIAITTSNSIKVKAGRFLDCHCARVNQGFKQAKSAESSYPMESRLQATIGENGEPRPDKRRARKNKKGAVSGDGSKN